MTAPRSDRYLEGVRTFELWRYRQRIRTAPLSKHAFTPDPVRPRECKYCGRRPEAHSNPLKAVQSEP
jgi:hypothetical protein